MSYRDTVGWQKGIEIVISSYAFASTLPESEKFGLIPQIKRAATSIPANVAEGYGRGSKADYARFVYIAVGSTRELQTHVEVCERLGLGTKSNVIEDAERLARILMALAKSLKSDKSP